MRIIVMGLLAWLALLDVSVAAPPNILLIVAEDMSPDLGCYGEKNVPTPHIDRLAGEGVRFTRAYVTTASCSESRASLLTGLHPHQHGQLGVATHGYAMFRAFDTMPTLLRRHGYRTGIIGKLHIKPEGAFEFDFHWQEKANSFSQRDVSAVADAAERFMRGGDEGRATGGADAPFFLMVNYADAHLPYLRQQHGLPARPVSGGEVHVPEWVGVDTDRLRGAAADYYNCISRLDTGIGMLLDRLERAAGGIAERTIVIFLSDHGAQFPRGKLTSYEGGVRVPLIVRGGGAVAGAVRDELVSTIDLLPTVLEAAGVRQPAGLGGRSLLPMLRGGEGGERPYAFTEYHSHYAPVCYPQRTIRDGRYKLILNLLGGEPNPIAEYYEGRGGHTPQPTLLAAGEIEGAAPEVRRMYEQWRRPPVVELYDLEADPNERVNLAGRADHAAVQARLTGALQQWRERTADPLLDAEKLRRFVAENRARAAGEVVPEHGYHRYLAPEPE